MKDTGPLAHLVSCRQREQEKGAPRILPRLGCSLCKRDQSCEVCSPSRRRFHGAQGRTKPIQLFVFVIWPLMQDRGHWPAARDVSDDQGRAGLAPALHRPGVRVDDSQDAGKRALIVSSVVVANTFCPAPSGPQHQALGDWVLGLRRSFCKTYQPFAVFCWHTIFRTLCCRGRRLRNGAGQGEQILTCTKRNALARAVRVWVPL